jgi:hypothetical protein
MGQNPIQDAVEQQMGCASTKPDRKKELNPTAKPAIKCAPMNLDQAQRTKVTEWIAQGEKLSSIQNRLAAELGVQMTYMEVRLLVDDLKLTPKDAEPPPPSALSSLAGSATQPPGGQTPGAPRPAPETKAPQTQPAATGGVSVSVDQLARPGALVSGKVTFSDGNKAEWYLDQSGRLGLVPQQAGYRPPQPDVQQFQMALETELSKMGF